MPPAYRSVRSDGTSGLAKGRRPHALLGTAIAIGVAMFLLVAGVLESRYEAERAAEAKAAATAQLLSREVERMMEASELMLEQAALLALRTRWEDPADVADAQEKGRHLLTLLPAASALILADENGTILSATLRGQPNASASPQVSVVDRNYFKAHRNGEPGPIISGGLKGRMTGRDMFAVSLRVAEPSGAFRGTAIATFDVEALANLYAQLSVMEGSSFLLGTLDGNALLRLPRTASTPAADQPAAPSDFLNAVRQGPEHGRYVYRSHFDGVERVSYYRRIGNGRYPLYVSFGIAPSAVDRAWIMGARLFLALSVLALLATCTAGVIALRRARSEERHRLQLTELNHQLAEAKEGLEKGIADRTQSLVDTLERLSRALEEKERLVDERGLLLREMNHRIKNSLQMVAAVLGMQAGMQGNEETKREFAVAVDRVMAVARLHEELYRADDARSVEIIGYLRGICLAIARSALPEGELGSVAVAGEPLVLAPDKAVALGLVANELVTNALKHGRPADRRQGPLVQVSAEHGGGTLRLTVRDFGPGLPEGTEPRRSAGLGMRLVRGMATQLNGTLIVERASPGSLFGIAVPLDGQLGEARDTDRLPVSLAADVTDGAALDLA